VGHSLHSCTDRIQVSPRFRCAGRDVVLVDTPGFNDTDMSDAEVLKKIATYLKDTYVISTGTDAHLTFNSYKDGKKLKGIIWLHPINDVRVYGISKSNFRMFRNLCGDSTLVNVVIATTKWSKEDISVAEAREKELREADILFKPALEKHARLVRHDENTRECAHQIIALLFPNTPLTLQIQQELVDMRKALGQTAAGAELKRRFELDVQEITAKLEALDAQMKLVRKEGDSITQKEMEEERQEMNRQIRKLRMEAQKLMVDHQRSAFLWRVYILAFLLLAALMIVTMQRTIRGQLATIDQLKEEQTNIMGELKMAKRMTRFMAVAGTAAGYGFQAIRAFAI
jgi:hypothetical protein